MWFEGSFLICCSVAGHSVWEIIATSCSISLWPAECCHKNCLAEPLDNDELGVWYYCHAYPLICCVLMSWRLSYRRFALADWTHSELHLLQINYRQLLLCVHDWIWALALMVSLYLSIIIDWRCRAWYCYSDWCPCVHLVHRYCICPFVFVSNDHANFESWRRHSSPRRSIVCLFMCFCRCPFW